MMNVELHDFIIKALSFFVITSLSMISAISNAIAIVTSPYFIAADSFTTINMITNVLAHIFSCRNSSFEDLKMKQGEVSNHTLIVITTYMVV